MNRGTIYATSAYIFWGLHPVYWKTLKSIPATEILAHRIFWSFIFFTIIISTKNGWKSLYSKFISTRNKWIIIVPAFLIGSNWGMYIWAVNTGYIIETSLGYFICPLVSIFLGIFFLHEKLRKIQWLSVSIAAFGVVIMTVLYGQFPWISMYLAVTWGTYGLLRKKSPLSSVEGLTLETLILSLLSITYLFMLYQDNSFHFFDTSTYTLLLIGAGVISGLPLLIFITGARLISLSVVGILQYIYPTMIFLTGLLIYHETLDKAKLTGLSFIWLALIIYTIESTFYIKKTSKI